MGTVYMAEQTEPVARRVALKIIKLGMDTKEVVARFEAERQALAVMDHPSIAKVFDAGATPEGRPYFVMELVQGVPIDHYCDSHRLDTSSRIRLFVHVCQAVQHAHQKGVIHRDLKPSNVLVTLQDGKPVPKVIDFGVAKAIDRRLSTKTLYTELGQRIGTPDFMSPEQMEMSGLDVDTRSDVYSLGVMLYVLLTGAMPYEPETVQKALISPQILRETEPPTPSTRLSQLGGRQAEIASQRQTDVSALRRLLKGDLDWITLKALARDRTRRYETANAVAADLQRFLAREPVTARPPSTTYRMGRFVARHRIGVAFASLLVVMLTGFAIAMAVQAQRVARERDRAEREAARATAVNEFLTTVLGSADPWKRGDRDITVLAALDESVRRVAVAFGDDPLTGAAVRHTIADTYASLGRFDEAAPLLRETLAVQRRELGADDATVAATLASLASVVEHQGDFDESIRLEREALAIRRARLGSDDETVVRSLTKIAHRLFRAGHYDDAEKIGEEALALGRRV